MLISGVPSEPVDVPEPIRAAGAGASITPVWVNGQGGLTFQLGAGPDRRFAKWAPAGSGIDLDAERQRMGWAGRYATVPQVLDHGADRHGSWLLTVGLPGDSAVSDHWKARPETAVRAAGAGLRALHDVLPVVNCPFSWSVGVRLQQATGAGQRTDMVPTPPAVDRLVVCHGDPCTPNTLIDVEGRCSGHVDFSSLGTADRWADLAVATWSTEWNYGPGWEQTFLQAYGVEPDPERTRFYRALWDL